jgi:hypothetical protein
MQSTNVRQIKTALVEQAFLGSTRVSCPLGQVVAESLSWGHWTYKKSHLPRGTRAG